MKEQTAAVQRMQDYIEAHLEADITLAQLSAVSPVFSWHSYRLFKELFGVTPAEYIRRLRLFPLRHAAEGGTVPCDGGGL